MGRKGGNSSGPSNMGLVTAKQLRAQTLKDYVASELLHCAIEKQAESVGVHPGQLDSESMSIKRSFGSDADAVYASKLDKKQVLSTKQPSSQSKDRKAKKRTPASARIRDKLPHTYETYLPLHRLWVSYFDSILGIDGKVSASGSELAPDAIAAKSLKADLHGALVGIMKCCSRKHMEGMQGLIIIETEHTFRLVTAENKLLSVPKHGTLLALRHRGWVIAVNGSAIEYRPWDRALRKWKSDSTLCSL